MNYLRLLLLLCLGFIVPLSANEMYLRDNLRRAKPGDYIVTAQNKTYTLLHIHSKVGDTLTIEEITVPANRIPQYDFYWKTWVSQNAPCNTSWVMYAINLQTGEMLEFYSFTKNGWYDLSQADNILSTLLNLKLSYIPPEQRKKVGPPPVDGSRDWRSTWQPRMVVDGEPINGVAFDGWRTHWPKDGSELSGKAIEVYVPHENDKYPSYFPYWLQISGVIGKAKVRIIDSGTEMESPKPGLAQLQTQLTP